MSVLLEAHDIHRIYRQGRESLHVLKGVNLKVERGKITSIVGPSGAGKSTLLHILGGLDRPDRGEVIFDGQNIYGLNDILRARLRNKKIGFVFQFYHLLPEFTALENLILPGLIAGRNKKELKARARELLDLVGLSHRAAHRPSELSGGEQQRVAIARAMANDPEIILCDEPTGNLDSENSRRIVDLIQELNKKNKQTFILVTHDRQIAECGHRILRMEDGCLL